MSLHDCTPNIKPKLSLLFAAFWCVDRLIQLVSSVSPGIQLHNHNQCRDVCKVDTPNCEIMVEPLCLKRMKNRHQRDNYDDRMILSRIQCLTDCVYRSLGGKSLHGEVDRGAVDSDCAGVDDVCGTDRAITSAPPVLLTVS